MDIVMQGRGHGKSHQRAIAAKIAQNRHRYAEQLADKFMVDNPPTVMMPKALFIAVRRVLLIPVYAPVRQQFPDGSAEIRLERIV